MDHKEIAARGGKVTASKLTPEERSARAKKASESRWGKKTRHAVENAIEASKDGAIEQAMSKAKAHEPYTGPSRTPIEGEVGMPGHSDNCQCMACRAHRAGWRP